MSSELENLLASVEREMTLLRSLPDAEPRPSALAQTLYAVQTEGERLSRQQRTIRSVQRWVSVAAAVLLAVVFRTSLTPQLPAAAPAVDAEQYLAEWSAAWDQSSTRVGELLANPWAFGASESTDEAADVNTWFESLDTSLEELEAL